MLVSADRQRSYHVAWNLSTADADLLEVTADEAQTDHHNSDNLQHQHYNSYRSLSAVHTVKQSVVAF